MTVLFKNNSLAPCADTDNEDDIEPPHSQAGPARTLSMEQHDLCYKELCKMRKKVAISHALIP